jgi:hypothetical protein
MIIKVGGPGNLSGVSNVKRKDSRKAAGNFSEFLSTDEASEAKHSSGVHATGIIGAMLALEEQESATEKPLRRARRLLDHLDEVRLALLAGGIPEQTIRRLQKEVAAERSEIVDPKLLDLLEEIETRAAVELAKLEQSKAEQKE